MIPTIKTKQVNGAEIILGIKTVTIWGNDVKIYEFSTQDQATQFFNTIN